MAARPTHINALVLTTLNGLITVFNVITGDLQVVSNVPYIRRRKNLAGIRKSFSDLLQVFHLYVIMKLSSYILS